MAAAKTKTEDQSEEQAVPASEDAPDAGAIAYAAYSEAMGGEGLQGPLPDWYGVPNEQQAAWRAAAEAVKAG